MQRRLSGVNQRSSAISAR